MQGKQKCGKTIKEKFKQKGERCYETNEKNHGSADDSNYDNGNGSHSVCR